MEYIKRALSGQEKLWIVFWLYNVALGHLLLFLTAGMVFVLAAIGLPKLIFLFIGLIVLWAIVVIYCIWACAFNCSWKGWGYISRVFVIALAVGGTAGLFIKFVIK